MSRQLIESFFPAITGLQRPLMIPRLLSKLLPDDVANVCPENIMTILLSSNSSHTFPLRRPILAVSAIFGIQIGLGGSLQLWLTRRRKMRNSSSNDDTESSIILWSLAFLFFGMMNITGLLVHCLLPAYEYRKLVSTYPTLWALDCIFTGFSSMSLIGAGLSNEFWTSRISRSALLRILCELARSNLHWIALTCVLASCAVLSFLVWGVTSPLELWYLWITAMAAHILLPITAKSLSNTASTPASTMERRGIFILFGGGLLFAIGLAFDSVGCHHLHDALLDLPTAPTLLFLGCDISFFGLYIWLRNSSCYNFGAESKQLDGLEKVE